VVSVASVSSFSVVEKKEHRELASVFRRFVSKLYIGTIVLCLFGLAGCSHSSLPHGFKEVVFVAPDGSERGRFHLEVADTEPLRQKGLMFRDSLPAEGGMLFIFESVAPRTFWMKNTKISLDMIFIGEDRAVQGIVTNVPPMNEQPRSVPNIESRYVVELGAGVAESRGIRVGDVVRW
jgi:uncharacterized membrane protein (UPF0127 family)